MIRFTFTILIFIFSGCREDDPGLYDYDYLVFGHFFGKCSGENCIEIFKITGTDIYEDTNDTYPAIDPPYTGNFTKLNRSLYAKISGLDKIIPSELVNTKERTIGQPDAGDWGGVYFEFSAKGKREYWIIDKNRNNIPEYLIPFVQEIEDRIELLASP